MTVSTLTVLRLTVELAGPWLVGDPEGLGDVDTAPLRDTDNSPQVPATSVAGSLRDHLYGCQDLDVQQWMGDRPGRQDSGRTASKLRVLHVCTSGGDRTAHRTTTAVDRRTGSAKRNSLRHEEHVEAPATLTLYLMHPGDPHPALLEALATWRPVIGRRRTHGWGRASVADLRYGRVDLHDREQLVRWLAGGGPALVDALATVPVEPASPAAASPGGEELLRVQCALVDGLHIGTGEDLTAAGESGEAPQLPTRIAGVVTRDATAYVPASSWRGVFRAHAGFILRSLGLPEGLTKTRVAEVFGCAKRRGLLTFHDAPLVEPANVDYCHVGIDRVTGGARPGLLFGERSVRGTVELRVSAERPDAVPGWACSVLRHTVRDIADGYLAVGGRTTRGLGTLAILDRPADTPDDGIDIRTLTGEKPGPGREATESRTV